MIYRFKDYQKNEIKRGHLKLGETRADGSSFNVNSTYIERNGKPWIGVMGEYHFVRDNRENWEAELIKMKAGGITIVATYVFWIYHEEVEGEYDFSGDRDLRSFVTLCKKHGLYVMLRIGPWCHGEVRNGGFPDWLLKKGCRLRENNDEYLELVSRWYSRIFSEVDGLLFNQGGPIIGVQIENELTDEPEHLATLKELAMSVGFKVPLWTVTGWNSAFGAKVPLKDFLVVFGAYVDAPWSDHTKKLPPSKHFTFDTMRNDAAIGMDLINATDDDGWRLPYEDHPFATCELGSGLPIAYMRRSIVSGMDAYALSLVKLGCGNNLVGYYMYHGGTNKIGKLSTLQESRATGYPNDYPILNYDFHTCISQYGQTNEQYELCNILHLFIKDFGDMLAPMEHVAATEFVKEDDVTHLRYAMRTDGKSGFIFVNHHQRFLQLEDVSDVVFDTGTLRFPSIDVKGDIAFILPFNIKLFGRNIDYATLQLVCKGEKEIYFARIEGIEPRISIDKVEYTVSDGRLELENLSIIVLEWQQARRLRKVDDRIYFEPEVKEHKAVYTKTLCEKAFDNPYEAEFYLLGDNELKWFKLSVDSSEGFVEIRDKHDVAQIYADGVLVADSFYDGLSWNVPAALIYGKEAYLIESSFRQEIYLDLK